MEGEVEMRGSGGEEEEEDDGEGEEGSVEGGGWCCLASCRSESLGTLTMVRAPTKPHTNTSSPNG